MALKEAHRQLKAAEIPAQLIPGDPTSALMRAANSLQNMDLVLISAEHDDASLAVAWFYIPRMLHSRSIVLRESHDAQSGSSIWAVVPADEISTRAAAPRTRRAA